MWYQDNISFGTDMKILLLTFWKIVFPKSELTYRVFKDLPERPAALTLRGLVSAPVDSLRLINPAFKEEENRSVG